ncbi:hypothetical protein [Mycobacterium haemophilum]|nr:hypothetical protein [Mycobacterium haemophilum]
MWVILAVILVTGGIAAAGVAVLPAQVRPDGSPVELAPIGPI